MLTNNVFKLRVRNTCKLLASLLVFNLFLGAGVALAKEDTATQVVTSNLSAWKISSDKAGKELAQKAETAKPGDVIEYRVEYKNLSTKTAT